MEGCTFGDLVASDRWQQIQSPEYPRPFPAQTQCSWRWRCYMAHFTL